MERVKKIVHARKVYELGYTGKGVRIALLDTGVFPHTCIKERVVFFKDYINGKRRTYDDNGHGTHIAGILSAVPNMTGYQNIWGMAPKADLLVFKILDKNGNGQTDKAVQALDWILSHHKEWNIKLLNFSMGYLPNANPKGQKQLLDKLELLWEEGITVVTAAGNNGPKANSITVPGISRKVITVGSSDDFFYLENGQRKQGTEFAYGGRGPTSCCIVKPEILAPGTNILSLANTDNQYVRKSGTSMSAPIVCGALALAYEKQRELKPVEMKLMLYDTVSPLKAETTKSWGILNVDNLIKML